MYKTEKKHLKLPYNPALKEKARELRKAGNLSEVLIWNQLKRKQFKGLDFDRQRVIGNYIVDFYCKQYGIILEIDGISHTLKEGYDVKREEYLLSFGLKIIRLNATDVLQNLDSVMMWLGEHEYFSTTPSAIAATPSLLKGNYRSAIAATPSLLKGN